MDLLRRMFRFRLRTLLLLVTACACLTAYSVEYYRRSRRGVEDSFEHGLSAFLYVPVDDVLHSEDLTDHDRMVSFFAPANWLDRHVFDGPSPVPIRQKIIKGVLVISNVQAAVEDIHVAPFTGGNGSAMQELTADIRNNGIEPVRTVNATVTTLGEFGTQTWSGCDIFDAWDSEPGILPGELGRNPKGQGHPFPAILGERFTQITVSKVSSSGATGKYRNPVGDGD